MPAHFRRTLRALRADRSRFATASVACGALFLLLWALWLGAAEVPVRAASVAAHVEVGRAAHPATAEIGGQIRRVHFVLGERVEQGAVLAELDAEAQALRLAEIEARRDARAAEAEATLAEIGALDAELVAARRALDAGVAELERRLSAARARERHLAEEVERHRQLAASGGVTRVELERKRLEHREAADAAGALESQLAGLRAEHDRDRAERERERAALERSRQSALAEAAALEAEAARVRHDRDRALIRAPVSGRIGDVRDLRPGAVVAPGDTLALITPDGELRVVARFPVGELGRIRVGQRAELRLDAFPWTQYGKVPLRVARVASSPQGSSFRIELEPEPPAPELLTHGLTGVVEVETERSSPFSLVLRSAAGLISP